MNGVDIVYQQAAVGAFEAYLCGTEDRLKQPQEQPDTGKHDDDGQQTAARTDERDIPEAGGRQGSDGEIEGIDVTRNLRIEGVKDRRLIRIPLELSHRPGVDAEAGPRVHQTNR